MRTRGQTPSWLDRAHLEGTGFPVVIAGDPGQSCVWLHVGTEGDGALARLHLSHDRCVQPISADHHRPTQRTR